MRRAAFILLALAVAGAAAAAVIWLQRQRAVEAPGVVTLEEAWVRVRGSPRDAYAWAALGDAQASLDQLEASEASYRTALRIAPQDGRVHARLGFLFYGWGRDREALISLEHADHLGAEVDLLDFTLAQLHQAQAPAAADVAAAAVEPEPDPPQEPSRDAGAPCTVPVRRTSAVGTFLIDADVGGVLAPLIIDTGASLTALDRALVEETGAVIDEERTIRAITAAGPIVFSTAVIERIRIAGREVERVRVAVCDQCGGPDTGGLLGLDVQAPLMMDLDVHDAAVRFVDCRAD